MEKLCTGSAGSCESTFRPCVPSWGRPSAAHTAWAYFARLCSQGIMSWKTVFKKETVTICSAKTCSPSQKQPNLDLRRCTFCHVIYKIGEANIVIFHSELNAIHKNRCLPNVHFMDGFSFCVIKYCSLQKSGNPKNIIPALMRCHLDHYCGRQIYSSRVKRSGPV